MIHHTSGLLQASEMISCTSWIMNTVVLQVHLKFIGWVLEGKHRSFTVQGSLPLARGAYKNSYNKKLKQDKGKKSKPLIS